MTHCSASRFIRCPTYTSRRDAIGSLSGEQGYVTANLGLEAIRDRSLFLSRGAVWAR